MKKALALGLGALGLCLAATQPALAWRNHAYVTVWGGPYAPYPGYYPPPPVYYPAPVVVYPPPAPPVIYAPPVTYQAPPLDAIPTGPVYRDAASGQYCREFQSSVTVGGMAAPSYGRACQQMDGAWRIVP